MNSFVGSLSTGLLARRICLDKKLYSGVRTLFNGQYLGVDSFLEAREERKKAFGAMKTNFMTRMKQQLTSSSSSLIFTDDLKAVVYLAEDNEEELNIFTQMIKKFNAQNRELRFGTFIFGPLVMRLLHHFEKTDLALQLIKDEEIGGFFDQLKSYLLTLDLLYEQGQYQDVLDVFEKLVMKQLVDTKYPRDGVLLALAACYKLNTPESFEIALDIIKRSREAGSNVVRRGLHFAIALALSQDKPDVALELLSCLNTSNYVTNNNLKILTLTKLDRLHDALSILQHKVEQDFPVQATIRGDICQTVLDIVKESIDKKNDTELTQTFDQLYQSLMDARIITSETIDDLLSVPIAPRPFIEDRERFGGDRRGYPGNTRYSNDRTDPFYRRRSNIPARQQAYGSFTSE